MFLLTAPSIYQVSAFEALRVGHYDGTYEVRKLTKHGNFGVGTFNGLDGEMIVFQSRMYQIDAFGDTKSPPPNSKTPFALVTAFHPKGKIYISASMTSKEIQAEIDKRFKGGMLAIHVHGQFSTLNGRSFARQQKPYLPFGKIGDRQSLFPYKDVEGDLVGFRMPSSVGTLNVPGYHFHFISLDKKHGGHVLGFELKSGTVEVMPVSGITQVKPQ